MSCSHHADGVLVIAPLVDVLFAAVLLGATSMAARFVVWFPARWLPAFLPWLQSAAVGLLVGDALLHVLPGAIESGLPVDAAMGWLAAGIVALVTLESAIRPRHAVDVRNVGDTPPATFARMSLAGDFLHHLVDGVVVSAGFMAGNAAGMAVMVAIAAHEIPREISSASVLVAGGYPPRKAFWLSVAMATAVPLGALLMYLVQLTPVSLGIALSIAAGTVLYVALADILPGVWARARHAPRMAPAIGLAAGLLVMWVAARLET